MKNNLTIAFIGGGNMAWALACGLADRLCPAKNIQVVEIHEDTRQKWQARGMVAHASGSEALRGADVWIYAVKPQAMAEVVAATRAFLRADTLVLSVAAGIRAATLARWLGSASQPWGNVVRIMPNTPALVGAGTSGLAALPEVDQAGRGLAEAIFSAVGQVVWVEDDAALDAVTALSGSGPAYVFLFIESLIAGGVALGLSAQQARELALGTLAGATRLASESADPPGVLREKVTSKGGTTAAALSVFAERGFADMVHDAMLAACRRSGELADDAEN